MLITEHICVIMRKRKQKACFLKGRKEEIKMRHCQYCDALNPDDALHCNAETVENRFRLPEKIL